jgi:hypothetical protein
MEMHRTLKAQKFNFRLAFPYLKKESVSLSFR